MLRNPYSLLLSSLCLVVLYAICLQVYESEPHPEYVSKSIWMRAYSVDGGRDAVKLYMQSCPDKAYEKVNQACVDNVINFISKVSTKAEVQQAQSIFQRIGDDLHQTFVVQPNIESQKKLLLTDHNQSELIYLKYSKEQVKAMGEVWVRFANQGLWEAKVTGHYIKICKNSMSFVNNNCVDIVAKHFGKSEGAKGRDRVYSFMITIRNELKKITHQNSNKRHVL